MANRMNNAVTKTQGIHYPLQSPRLLTLKEASKVIGLSVWALRERIWQGLLPVVQFPQGRKMYLDTRDIDKFISDNKRVIR